MKFIIVYVLFSCFLAAEDLPTSVMVQESYPQLSLRSGNRVYELRDVVITYRVDFLRTRATPVYFTSKEFSERGVSPRELNLLRNFARKHSRRIARELKNEMVEEFFDHYLAKREYNADKLECSRLDDTNSPFAGLLHKHIFAGNLDLRLNCEYRPEAISGFGTMVTKDNICFVFSRPQNRRDLVSVACEVKLLRRGALFSAKTSTFRVR